MKKSYKKGRAKKLAKAQTGKEVDFEKAKAQAILKHPEWKKEIKSAPKPNAYSDKFKNAKTRVVKSTMKKGGMVKFKKK